MRSPAMHGPRRSRNFSGSRLPVISKGLSPFSPSSSTSGGLAPNELINQCYRALTKMEMDRALKVQLIDALGETDFRLSEGAGSDIQMEALIARFVLASAGKR